MNDDPAVLLTPRGQEILSRLAAARDAAAPGLALAERLRREYPAGLVALAMAQQELRRTAEAKFSRAPEMLFARAGYEQSSSEAIARYRAARLDGARRVADLCCGIGGDLKEPGEYLLDPNPAITRAGLVEDLARSLGHDIAKIDPRIAFLTLDSHVETPFARTLRVAYSAPWNEKQFARRLRDLSIGAADIRRRGLAGDVDQIRRRLKLSGPNRATIVITRVNDKPWGLICTAPDGIPPA